MEPLASLLVVTKLLALGLGLLVVRAGYRAYRRTGSRALRALTVAFALITLGGAVGGSLDRLLDVGLEAAVLANSALTAVGFAVLAYSLYVADDPTAPV